MTNCEFCGKPINPQAGYVRLNDERTKQAHVKCFAKSLFPEAKDNEIKIKPVIVGAKANV